MNKEDAIRIAAELNNLKIGSDRNNKGLPYKFEATENCEDPYLNCEGRCKTTDHCWMVKIDEDPT